LYHKYIIFINQRGKYPQNGIKSDSIKMIKYCMERSWGLVSTKLKIIKQCLKIPETCPDNPDFSGSYRMRGRREGGRERARTNTYYIILTLFPAFMEWPQVIWLKAPFGNLRNTIY